MFNNEQRESEETAQDRNGSARVGAQMKLIRRGCRSSVRVQTNLSR